MTAMVVAQSVSVESSKRVVVLPRVCSWYLADFAPANRKIGVNAVPLDCLRTISPYIPSEDATKLTDLLLNGASPTIKFKDYRFRARAISIAAEE